MEIGTSKSPITHTLLERIMKAEGRSVRRLGFALGIRETVTSTRGNVQQAVSQSRISKDGMNCMHGLSALARETS